jgi:hypothetical protein
MLLKQPKSLYKQSRFVMPNQFDNYFVDIEQYRLLADGDDDYPAIMRSPCSSAVR